MCHVFFSKSFSESHPPWPVAHPPNVTREKRGCLPAPHPTRDARLGDDGDGVLKAALFQHLKGGLDDTRTVSEALEDQTHVCPMQKERIFLAQRLAS